jgi:membrane fusion protein (multidrug efflux system)
VVVDAVPVERMQVDRTVEALGTVEAIERVTISSEIDGVVQAIHFQEGETVVRDGAEAPVLLQLDPELLELEVAIAEANLRMVEEELRQAEAAFERKKLLFEGNAVSEAAYTDARLARDRAAAARAHAALLVQQARARLARTVIRAPITGVLGEKRISPGAFVRRGDPLAEIVQLDPVDVAFSVPERFRAELRIGMDCAVRTPAVPGRVFHGQVRYVAPAADPATRTVRLKARLRNENLALKPGLFAQVELVLSREAASLVVPEQAVVPRGEKFFVYVADGGIARRREVRLGQRLPGRVEIVEGLEGGETVITAGLQRVSDGAAVQVRPPEGGR